MIGTSFSLHENFTAVAAMRALRNAGRFFTDTAERLATGFRVNKGADGAATLHISEKMRAQIRGLERAARNAQDGVSLVQTAEGALVETQQMLHRMRELAVQAASDTMTAVDRGIVSSEILELGDEIDQIAQNTSFNTQLLLDGSLGSGGTPLTVQVGAAAGDQLSITIEAADATTLGVDTPPTGVDDAATWSGFIATVDGATAQLSQQRIDLGAQSSRLKHFLMSLNVASENSRASDSRFRDADMAEEMVTFNRARLLKEPGMAALIHANLIPESTLLLYGTVRQPGQPGP